MALIARALTTVARVREAGALSVDDSQVELSIGAVSIEIEKMLGRRLGYRKALTSAPERYQGTGQQSLFVRRWPILAVERVQIRQSTLSTAEDVTDFLDDPDFLERGELWRDYGWPKIMGVHSDLTGDPNPSVRGYPIELAYTGGYILPQFNAITDAINNPGGLAFSLPPNIELACIDSVLWFAQPSTPEGLRAERTAGGWSEEWDVTHRPITLTAKTMGLLSGERGWWFE